MIFIDPINVYTANANKLGSESRGTLTVDNYDYADKTKLYGVTGLQPHDFAIFGYLLSMEGSDEQDWIVTNYRLGEATLVNSTPFLENPRKYTTPHVEKSLRRMGLVEASQLSIDALTDYVFQDRPSSK